MQTAIQGRCEWCGIAARTIRIIGGERVCKACSPYAHAAHERYARPSEDARSIVAERLRRYAG